MQERDIAVIDRCSMLYARGTIYTSVKTFVFVEFVDLAHTSK